MMSYHIQEDDHESIIQNEITTIWRRFFFLIDITLYMDDDRLA